MMIKSTLRRSQYDLILLTFLLLLLTVTLHSKMTASPNIITHDFRLTDSFNTPVAHIYDATKTKSRGTALLVHGFQCNKSMMVQLGKFLASQGLDAYAIDLPGHGESSISFTLERCYDATREAVSEIIRLSGAEDMKMILIGHSFGATVLGPVALNRPDIAASIYIGPGEVENLKPETPRNVMIVTAEHDYSHIKKYAQKAYDDLTRQNGSRPGNTAYGNAALGTARTWQEVARSAHVGLIYNEATYQLVAEWIKQALPNAIEQNGFSPRLSKFVLILVLCICLMLASLTSKVFPFRPVPDTRLFANPLRPFVVFGYAIACGIAIMKFVTPLGFLRLKEGEVLASFVFLIGLSSLLLDMMLDRSITIRGIKISFWDSVVGLTVFVFLYFFLVVSAGSDFYNLRLAVAQGRRTVAFAVIAICSFPLFLMTERLLRYIQASWKGCLYGTLGSLAAALVFYTMFTAGLVMVDPGLFRFAEAFLGVIGYCTVIGTVLYQTRKSIVPGAIFTSLSVAWLISVGFIQY